MVRVLDAAGVRSVIELSDLLPVIESAFERQGRGLVERPSSSYFDIGLNPDSSSRPAGTAILMPAYIHGEDYLVTKIVCIHEGNEERDLPPVHDQIAMNDAATGIPVAYMDGRYVTAARTSCVGGLTARELTTDPIAVGIIGAGRQARWQLRGIDAATTIESATLYDIDEGQLAETTSEMDEELDCRVRQANEPTDVVENADILVTATTSSTPVFSGEALKPGAVVVAIGAYTSEMQEVDSTTFDRAARVFADVPETVEHIGDIQEADFLRADLVPFSAMVSGDAGRKSPEEILVVESVGSSVMDAAAAAFVFERAEEGDIGTTIDIR